MITPKDKQIETSETREKSNNEEEFSVNKIQIITFDFLLHVSGLLPPNNATPFIKLLHKIFLTGIFSLYTSALFGQVIGVYIYWGNIPVISTTVGHMSALLLAVIACAYFLRNKEKYKELVDLMKTEFVAKVTTKYVKFIHHAERQIKLYLWISVPLVTLLGIIWVTAPFVNKDTSSNFSNITVSRDENNLKRLMFAMWLPFGVEDSPQYEIILGLQIIVVSLPIAMLAAVDLTFMSLMGHAAAQFKVLCAMLNDMHENITESKQHRTEPASPMRVSTDDSSVAETLTSTNDILCHESGSGIPMKHSSEMRQENCHVIIDPCQLYLVDRMRHHQALIA
jgi:cation transport ATPase